MLHWMIHNRFIRSDSGWSLFLELLSSSGRRDQNVQLRLAISSSFISPRDVLLSKLLSGKILVKDAERIGQKRSTTA